MTKSEARAMVAEYLLADSNWAKLIKPVIQDEHTIETEFGWVFFYQSHEFVTTKDNPLVGNAPLIVDKDFCILVETGTSERTETYIAIYQSNRGNIEGFEGAISRL